MFIILILGAALALAALGSGARALHCARAEQRLVQQRLKHYASR